MKILLVDDDVFICAYLVHVLTIRGHQVVERSTGLEGLAAIRNETFDLAVVDVVMPDMDGIELVGCLRDRFPNLPILGVSGGDPSMRSGGKLYLDLMRHAGADQVLEKPFEEKEFLEAIEVAMGHHHVA
ncbi:MAG: hypothetical protein B9S32_15500 [Verrucomicrobia bacterium Tous-C9LFEB]|nr:MAG: hypothetical protein B9S32_15500 [Verrucomicrobia bacterium Tous-C9LFEB]